MKNSICLKVENNLGNMLAIALVLCGFGMIFMTIFKISRATAGPEFITSFVLGVGLILLGLGISSFNSEDSETRKILSGTGIACIAVAFIWAACFC